jgi:hypothetical protein
MFGGLEFLEGAESGGFRRGLVARMRRRMGTLEELIGGVRQALIDHSSNERSSRHWGRAVMEEEVGTIDWVY